MVRPLSWTAKLRGTPTLLLLFFSRGVKALHSGPSFILLSFTTSPQSPQVNSPDDGSCTMFVLLHSGQMSSLERLLLFLVIFFPLLGGSPSQVLPLERGLEDCSRGLFGTGILVYLNASVSWFDGLVIVWLKGFTLFLYCVFDLLVVANEGSE